MSPSKTLNLVFECYNMLEIANSYLQLLIQLLHYFLNKLFYMDFVSKAGLPINKQRHNTPPYALFLKINYQNYNNGNDSLMGV